MVVMPAKDRRVQSVEGADALAFMEMVRVDTISSTYIVPNDIYLRTHDQ